MNIQGNKLTLKASKWSYNKEELYLRWVGTWDTESHTGNWISFDENGIPQNSGPM